MSDDPPGAAPCTRRDALRLAAAGAGLAGALAARPVAGRAAVDPSFADRTAAWLQALRRPDGGYAEWAIAPRSHLSATFAAVGALKALGRPPADPQAVAAFVRTHHPGALKKLEQEHHEFDFQQIQTLLWLDLDASAFRDTVAAWTRPARYLPQYERSGHPILRHELMAVVGRSLLGLPLDPVAPAYLEYLHARRRPDGSFNNTPAADDRGSPGHVVNTWWAVRALVLLNALDDPAPTVAWVRSCQLPNGGFTHEPAPPLAGTDDVAYTRAAVRTLALLGSEPADRDACVAYLRSLLSESGGAGDRPSWPARPTATYHALDALNALDAAPEPIAPPRRTPSRRPAPIPDGLRVYSIQLEAHGQGSPADAVELARSLRIHLWGAKNATRAWIDRAQSLADAREAPVRFFRSDEEYGSWLRVPGLGTYSHMSDIVAPNGADIGPPLAGDGATIPDWPAFRARRLEPLSRAGGRLVWQFGENEELVRLLLDDSLDRPGGFAALSTFHFGNPDFTNSEPFLERYRGRLPFVALQDAHGPEPWYFADTTEGFRTLFLAPAEPTWDAWLDALARNRVAAVRHARASNGETWIHAPSPEVLQFVRAHADDWRWWDNTPAIRRPLLSLVAIGPDDPFEHPRPDRGINLRVRVAWTRTAQGQPLAPLAQLESLRLDGVEATPTATALPRPPASAAAASSKKAGAKPQEPPRPDLVLARPDIAPGPHTAEARARLIATGEMAVQAIRFVVPG